MDADFGVEFFDDEDARLNPCYPDIDEDYNVPENDIAPRRSAGYEPLP